MSSSYTRRTTSDFYTYLGWTVEEFTDPSTTQLYTIIADCTSFATIRILPESVGGDLLLPNDQRVRPFDTPVIFDHALLAVGGDYEPTLIYSRIYGMIVSDPISTSASLPKFDTPAALSVTSFQTSALGGHSVSTAFQTSPSTRSTPTAPVSATTSTRGESVNGETLPDVAEKPKPSGGMIAGITIGVISALLFCLGAFIVLRRRRKSHGNTTNENDNDSAKRESDKMVVGSDEALDQSHAPRMSYHDHTQELDPSQPCTFSIYAHELKACATPGELSRYHSVSMSQPSPIDQIQDHDIKSTTNDTAVTPSPHVEAQRIRELEWLEMEEAKLRQRREQLIRQSGKHAIRPGDLQ